MTINLTIRQNDWIVVAADSAVTNIGTSTAGRKSVKLTEFFTEPNRKFHVLDGVCVVTTWGELPFDDPFDKLNRQNIDPRTHSVDEVAELVFRYLIEDYQPHKIFQDEEGRYCRGEDFKNHTGFHVCGFTREKKPKCYNIFWGTDIPPKTFEQLPDYRSYPKPYDDQPLKNDIEFIYTGRPDLASKTIRTFLEEIERGLETRYDIRTTVGILQLADLVMRFSAEITPRVGPPFHIALIDPDNHIQEIVNPCLSPLNLVQIGL